MSTKIKALCLYLLAVNVAAFLLYGVDKRRAKKEMWRIPEKTLFGVALLGGSVGAIAGMQVFRHKTRHWYFKFGLPAILIVQAGIAVYFAYFR